MTNKQKPEAVDVVIVGLGANGGTAAKVLSEAGLKVVGIERGPWLKNDKHYSGDELKFVNRNYMWPDSRLTPRTVRHLARRQPFPPPSARLTSRPPTHPPTPCSYADFKVECMSLEQFMADHSINIKDVALIK